MIDIEALCATLLAARESGGSLPSPLTEQPLSLADGYAIAEAVTARRLEFRARVVGRKIGLSSPQLLARFGLTQPIWAPMYDDTVSFAAGEPDGGRAAEAGEAPGDVVLEVSARHAPRLEAEIVLGLDAELAAGADEGDVCAAVGWVALGFELVDCHYPHWSFSAAEGIADFGLHAAMVVGAPRRVQPGERAELARVLAGVEVRMERLDDRTAPGEEPAAGEGPAPGELPAPESAPGREPGIWTGIGTQAMEGPVSALVALAAVPGAAPLRAGEIITTGALFAPPDVAGGQRFGLTAPGTGLDPVTVRLR